MNTNALQRGLVVVSAGTVHPPMGVMALQLGQAVSTCMLANAADGIVPSNQYSLFSVSCLEASTLYGKVQAIRADHIGRWCNAWLPLGLLRCRF